MLPEIIVYKMKLDNINVTSSDLDLIDLNEDFLDEYIRVYNKCFHKMREELKIEPFDYYQTKEQILEKMCKIKILVIDNDIIGSVAFYDNEIDDLFVNEIYQNKCYGKRILEYALSNMKLKYDKDIILHVANWNEKAIALYKEYGFEIIETIKVR